MGKKINSLKSGWYIWLFPIFAVLISAWMIWDYYRVQGPVIHILFDDAAGIQSGKTNIRFRGVPIGKVRDVFISEDQKDVVAEVLLRQDASHFAVDGSKFSLVTPKVNFQGISGLETIFEGTYIAVLPGPLDAPEKMVFKAQASAASTDTLDDTSPYLIEALNVENLNPGDSLTFRGLKIGSITKIILSKTAQTFLIHISVDNKHSRLVRENSIFWVKMGVQAKLGLFNSEIKVNSIDSIMNGGLEVATPNPAAPMAKALHKFPLFAAPPENHAKWNPALEFP